MSEGGAGAACLLCCIALPILGGSIAYLVFTIIFLVKDDEVCSRHSPLWVYVLGTLIINAIVQQQSARSGKEGDDEGTTSKVVKALYGMICPILNVIWGGIVMYGGYTCDNMKDTGLWIIAQIIFWSSVAVVGILFIAILFLCCAVCSKGSDGAAPPATAEAVVVGSVNGSEKAVANQV
jgi:hypothetical protein